MGSQGPTKGNTQLIRQNEFSFTLIKLVYCLKRQSLKCNGLVQKICSFLQKETSHHITLKMPRSSDFMYSSYFMLENIWHHHFTWSGPTSQEIVNFVPIVGPWRPELYWNKFTISYEFDPLQVKWWYQMFPRIKIELYMEPEFSGFFWVKMVAKNIMLGSPTHLMHMRVN